MSSQSFRERRFIRRLGLTLNLYGLKRYECNMILEADRVLDISQEDADYWRRACKRDISWLPTIVDENFVSCIEASSKVKDIDVLYFGNLNTPNNVEAVEWFLNKVLPSMHWEKLSLVLAGSNPTAVVTTLAKRYSCVHVVPNPDDMSAWIGRARVLINPMLAGSGVNLKSVEMLYSNAHLVSTSIGVKGLSSLSKECFVVADTPEDFAAAIQRCLNTQPVIGNRQQARAEYTKETLQSILFGSGVGVSRQC
jgi:hypothetical protein